MILIFGLPEVERHTYQVLYFSLMETNL